MVLRAVIWLQYKIRCLSPNNTVYDNCQLMNFTTKIADIFSYVMKLDTSIHILVLV